MYLINQKCYIAFHSLWFKNNVWNSESIVSVNCCISQIIAYTNKVNPEILRSFDQRKHPRGHFNPPDIFANISYYCNFHMYVCKTLLEGSLRDISVENILILIKVQPSYDRKCKESWILKTENCEKKLIFF